MSDEESRVALLRRAFGRAPRDVPLGIGDDAAVLAPGRERLVWTVDVQVEGVHFERSWLGLDALGYRSVMAAASDLAAMGARPRAVLAGLVLPPGFSDAALGALARGQARACRELGTAVVGGNLARGGELSVTTSVLGHAARPLLRSGARPGDGVWVAGATGLAGAGLAWLAHAGGAARVPAALRRAVAAWQRPVARIDAGALVARRAHAAIDLSDGLAIDLARLARASGVVVALAEEALVTEELARAAGALAARGVAASALELALHGGEDYALVAALPAQGTPARLAAAGFRCIGSCEALAPRTKRGASPLVLVARTGARRPLAPRGFDHFARGAARA